MMTESVTVGERAEILPCGAGIGIGVGATGKGTESGPGKLQFGIRGGKVRLERGAVVGILDRPSGANP